MRTNKIASTFMLLVLAALMLDSCHRNCDLRFDEPVELLMPHRIYPSADTMYLGDTLWVEIDFNRELQIHGLDDKKIILDVNDFRLTFFVSEVSGEEELYSSSYVEIIPHLGDIIGYNSNLTGQFYYPLTPVETVDRYRFKMAVVLKEVGLFSIGLVSLLDSRFIPSHPMLTKCENGKGSRASDVRITMHNELGNYDNFDFLMSNSQVPYFISPFPRQYPPIYPGLGVRVLER